MGGEEKPAAVGIVCNEWRLSTCLDRRAYVRIDVGNTLRQPGFFLAQPFFFFFYILLPYSNINVSNGATHAVVVAFFLLLLNEIAHRCELFWLELFQRCSVTLQHVLAQPLKRHCLALSLRKFLLRPFAVGQQLNSYKLPTSTRAVVSVAFIK